MAYFLRFDGVDDRVTGSAAASMANPNTLAIEIDFALPVVAQADKKIYRLGDGMRILIGPQSNGTVRFWCRSGGIATLFTPPLSAGVRYLIRCELNAVTGVISLSLNGGTAQTASIPSYVRQTIPLTRFIGCEDASAGFARQDLYGLKEFVNGSQVSFYDPSNTNSGTTLLDTVGSNNGTLVNFTVPDCWVFYSSGSTYQLTAQGGAFTYSGQTAALNRGFKLAAQGGAYTYTGASANLSYNTATVYRMDALGASYSYAGASASLLRGFALDAQGGAYSYAGSDAALRRGFRLAANGGAYNYAGADASLTYVAGPTVYRLTALGVTYVYSGADATLTATGVAPAANPNAFHITAQISGPQNISAMIGGTLTNNAKIGGNMTISARLSQ